MRRADQHSAALAVSNHFDAIEVETTRDSVDASRLLYVGYLSAHALGRDAEALDLVARTKEMDPLTSPDWSAQVRVNLANAHTAVGEHERAGEVMDGLYALVDRRAASGEAVRAYRRARMHEADVQVNLWKGLDAWTSCRCDAYYLSGAEADRLRERLDEAASLLRASGRTERLPLLDVYRAGIDLLRTRHAAARKHARTAIERADAAGYGWGALDGRLMLARIDLAAGHAEAALRHVGSARAVLDTTQSEDATVLQRRYGAEAGRIAAQIHHAEGHYGRLLATLWHLQMSDAPGARRHLAVAEASTVPLTETTGGLFVVLVGIVLAAGFVTHRCRRPRAPRREGNPAWRGDGAAGPIIQDPRLQDLTAGDASRSSVAAEASPVESVATLSQRVDRLHRGPLPDLADVRVDGPQADQTAGAWSLKQHRADWEAVDAACRALCRSVWDEPAASGRGLHVVFAPVQDVDRAEGSQRVVCPVTHRERDDRQRGSGALGRAVHVHGTTPFPHLEWTQLDDADAPPAAEAYAGRVFVPVDPSTLLLGRDAVLTAFLDYLEDRACDAALEADLVTSAVAAVRSLSQLQDGKGSDGEG